VTSVFWRRRRSGIARQARSDATSPGPGVDASPPRIVLVGRPGCHLCDDAEAIIARVAAEIGTTWTKVSVEDDPALHARWSDQVPVTLVDGRPHDFYRVSETRLRAALRS